MAMVTRRGVGLSATRPPQDEDAERVTGGVRVHAQWLFQVRGSVEEKTCAEGEGPLMLRVEVCNRRDRHIEVQHLRARAVRPGRLGQAGHLLERDPRCARGVMQDEPVLAAGIRFGGGWRLVAVSVRQAQELPVELGKPARVGAVDHDLPHRRHCQQLCHDSGLPQWVV